MKQEDSFGNIKSMQKQTPLFALIYLINSRSQGRQIINILLITISMVLNVVHFLSLKEINVLNNELFLLSSVFNLIFLPYLGLIILQLIFGYFYHLQFFISIQWKIFRFIIYPFLMSFLLSQSLSGEIINHTLSIILFVFILLISLILTGIVATESYVYKKLLHRDLPINFHLLIVESLFVICGVIQNRNIKMTLGFLITILSLQLYNNNFTVLKESSFEYRILCVSTFLLLWSGLVYCVQLFTETRQIVNLIIGCLPCLIYKVFSDLTRERAPVPYDKFIAIFQDPDTIDFEQFIDSMQPIIEQIMEYFYSQNKKDFVDTLLMGYYYEHSNRCLNVDCPFRNEDFKFEMKNMNDSKIMKDVLFKICKKIDFLYYGMYKTWPEHIDLKLSLVQFYIFCFPNKVRALEIISQIQLSKLSLQQDYQLFRVKILCQNMNSLEVAGQIKLDQRLIQFGTFSIIKENLIYLTLNTIMEFWSLFNEQKVDFNKLNSVTSKIFPLRQKIQEIFESRLSQETFSSLKILRLYSLYCGTIQNNQQKSWKINDYLNKLKYKLQQKKEVEYLSFDSEIGLVALSLSQNKLGNIAIVNSQASQIFNYSKKEFKSIKVNEIMPKIYADQHDSFLKVFIHGKNKKINSDERKMLGKNKSGYVFPIILQLQKTVSSTGDELLFIANIKKHKLKKTYIGCVTDQEGQITDYSSTFDYIFFKQQKSKGKRFVQNKNIQQFIPQFFDPNVEEDQNTHLKYFNQTVTIKNYGNIQIQYTISPVSFPLKQNGGFMIEGVILNQQKPLNFPRLSMTQSLKQMMNNNSLICHKNYYNAKLNQFQISKEEKSINIKMQLKKQFTIPFINLNDVSDIFGVKKEIIDWGQNIKTIRLVKDHFERVEDPTEFQSQFQMEGTQSTQAISQIIELKQSIVKDKRPKFMRNIKIILLILSVVCFIMCFILVNSYNTYADSNSTYLDDVRFKFQSRGYLSEYIVHYTALKNGFDQSIFEPMLESTKSRLIDSLQNSPIPENKKQEILKIAYLQSQANLTTLLGKDTLLFDYNKEDYFSPIMKVWYNLFILIALLISITTFSYFLFLNQLESIYQVFMCLQEKIIKKLYLSCRNLAKIIQKYSQRDQLKDDSQDEIKLTSVRQVDQNDEQNQNPVKKIRKFKEGQRFRNIFLLIKLILPFAIIIPVSIFAAATIEYNNSKIVQRISIHKEILKIVPQTSVFLMNTFLKNVQNYPTLASQNFMEAYQSIDSTLYQYEQKYAGHLQQSFFLTLLDNVCKKNILSTSQSKLCPVISGGTMTVGLSKSLNYFANRLINLQNYPKNITLVQDFNEIILLEYQFIFPLVQQMAHLMYNQLINEAQSFAYAYSTLTIVLIILIALNLLYFLRYPAYQIEERIYLSKGLIDLIPQYYKNQQPVTKQGYTEVKQQKQILN